MKELVKLSFLLTFIITAIIIIFKCNPEEYLWFPKCSFYQLTGLQCPACGSQRAVHAALHADFRAAFEYNPFMIISIPYAIGIVLFSFINTSFAVKVRKTLLHRTSVYIYVCLFIVWWIVRNII